MLLEFSDSGVLVLNVVLLLIDIFTDVRYRDSEFGDFTFSALMGVCESLKVPTTFCLRGGNSGEDFVLRGGEKGHDVWRWRAD